jgi:hypothetical protein
MRNGATSALATQVAKQANSRNPATPLRGRKKDKEAMKPQKNDEEIGSCLPATATAEIERMNSV